MNANFTLGRRGLSAMLVCLALTIGSSARAAIVRQHIDDNDPETEGFNLADSLTGSPINDGGVLAWVIDDDSVTDGLEYNTPAGIFTPAEIALGQTDGWQLTWKLRIVDGPIGSVSRAYEVGLTFPNAGPNRRYTFFHGQEADGDPMITEVHSGMSATLQGLGGGYHTYEFINAGGGTDSADLYIDGAFVFTSSGAADSSNSLYFGSRTDTPTGQGNWALFQFNVGEPPSLPVPEPSALLLLALASPCALWRLTRRRARKGENRQ